MDIKFEMPLGVTVGLKGTDLVGEIVGCMVRENSEQSFLVEWVDGNKVVNSRWFTSRRLEILAG